MRNYINMGQERC